MLSDRHKLKLILKGKIFSKLRQLKSPAAPSVTRRKLERWICYEGLAYFHQTKPEPPVLAQTKLPQKARGAVTAPRLRNPAQKGSSKLFKKLTSMEGRVC